MGACTSAKQSSKVMTKKASYRAVLSKLRQQEIKTLEMIFEDLASRSFLRKISRQNFLIFFKKNGFWGDCLFKQFDLDQSDMLNLNEFIVGITRIFKTEQREKILLLYQFFSKMANDQDGICYKQFLRMMYNYPKEDLAKIICQKEFMEKQIKLLTKGGSFSQECDVKAAGSEFIDTKTTLEDQFQPSTYYQSFVYNNPHSQGISKVINRIAHHDIPATTVVEVDENKCLLNSLCMNKLIKNYTKLVFKNFDVDTKTGKLQKQHFVSWITSHKGLYDDYYGGFRHEIWGTHLQNDEYTLNYLKHKPQLQAEAKMIIENEYKKIEIKKVQLLLINTFLIVTSQKNIKQPLKIICLDGLSVENYINEESCPGFEIKHRDGIYPNKKFLLKNNAIKQQWMEALKFYKGITVHQKYKFGAKIGAGKFSIVYECTDNQTGNQFACKQIETYKLAPQSKDAIAHQSAIMALLNHPFCARLHQSIQTRTHLYLIAELIKGKDLAQYVKSYGVLNQYSAAIICKEIIIGIEYLHSLGIVHQDLKPENILVQTNILTESDETFQQQNIKIKIIDFGFAQYVKSLQDKEDEKNNFIAGTPNFIAPEILKNQKITLKVDNFSIGSILYFMLSGHYAFSSLTMTQCFQKTIDGIYDFSDDTWLNVSQNAKDLVKKLLANDPNQRLSLNKALKHPWFKQNYSRKSIEENKARILDQKSCKKKTSKIF